MLKKQCFSMMVSFPFSILISVILHGILGGILVYTEISKPDEQRIRCVVESDFYKMCYGENPIKRFQVWDTHR